MTEDIAEIITQFRYAGQFDRSEFLKIGHINDTYAVYFQNGDNPYRYLLQRVNHEVFRQPELLMRNIQLVTEYLHETIIQYGGDPERETLRLVPTKDRRTYYRSLSGDYWRCYDFIEGTRTYQVAESLAHVYEAGRAFGNFLTLLSDFPVSDLAETIPNFHNTSKRFEAFYAALDRDICNRASVVENEIHFVLGQESEMSRIVDLLKAGTIPVRVTHNDTKFNNVLIDENTQESVCVVDLDTVMPGSALYDYGDAIRSIANTGAEDERDLGLVNFSLEIFDWFTKGYLQAAGDLLTPLEIELLPFSANLMTLECGMRFLTDYLNGDTYFRTLYPEHNLDRCRTQFKLVREMDSQVSDMERIVLKHLAERAYD